MEFGCGYPVWGVGGEAGREVGGMGVGMGGGDGDGGYEMVAGGGGGKRRGERGCGSCTGACGNK